MALPAVGSLGFAEIPMFYRHAAKLSMTGQGISTGAVSTLVVDMLPG
jgi:hypothetical protein